MTDSPAYHDLEHLDTEDINEAVTAPNASRRVMRLLIILLIAILLTLFILMVVLPYIETLTSPNIHQLAPAVQT